MDVMWQAPVPFTHQIVCLFACHSSTAKSREMAPSSIDEPIADLYTIIQLVTATTTTTTTNSPG